jgi:Family of unknown function (DUF6599)
MKLILAAVLLPVLSTAAILPEAVGPYHRTAIIPAPPADKAVWEDYGLKESESATYADGKQKLTITAWRLDDSTGAMAAFDWQRQPASLPSTVTSLAAETTDSLLFVYGNFLLYFNGKKPTPAELSAVTDVLKNVDSTALPPLADNLPNGSLIPNSQRFITGPASLERFYPGVPPSVAAFRYGAEAVTGTYRTPKGEMPLAIFNYPTHQIARERQGEFAAIPGAMVKRSGPLLAVVLNAPDADAAERLLGQVRYQATVTVDEYVPTKRDNIGNLVVNAFVLIGILLVFSLVSGLVVGGLRAYRHRGKAGEEADAILTLRIDQH